MATLVQQVIELIDELSHPDTGMSKAAYRDFLDELQSEIDAKLEAVEEELGELEEEEV